MEIMNNMHNIKPMCLTHKNPEVFAGVSIKEPHYISIFSQAIAFTNTGLLMVFYSR